MSVIAFAKRIQVRVFLEGVEVPVIGAQVQVNPNAPSLAMIQIPPLAEGTRLLPRTIVHMYFLDMYQSEAPFLSETGPDAQKPNMKHPTAYEREVEEMEQGRSTDDEAYKGFWSIDVKNSMYKLLFVGEVIGFQWTKMPRNRSLVLQCADLSNYWDYAYQWSNTDIFGPGIKALFSGGATNLFTDFLSSKGSVITGIVTSGRCNTFPNLKGMAAGIVRLIEAIGGTYSIRSGSGSQKRAGQNLFFSSAELRLHLTQMLTAYEDDPTSKRILQRQGYSGLFERALGNLGGQTSIRQAINALTKIMFHEIYPQPCPLYIPGSEGEVSGTRRTRVKNHPRWGYISHAATFLKLGLEQILSDMEALETEYADSSTSREARSSFVKKARELSGRLTGIQKQMQQLKTKIRQDKAPNPAMGIYATAAQSVSKAAWRVRVWNPRSPDFVKKTIKKDIESAIGQMERAEKMTYSEKSPKEREPARLVQQIFRPDIWFGPPPRCNVIFPDHYTQIEYQRMFLQEPTRFLLKTNDEFFGEDFLFDRFYFAPQAGTTRADHARIRDMLRNDLLDHELFTGILPVFEKMGEFNIFAARSGTSEGKIPKVSFAQRSANFLYFKHRFNARKMSVYARFNPYVACGFPGLIVDKYVDAETLRAHNEIRESLDLDPIEVSEILGTNFIGNFTSVSHNVSQQDVMGQTQIEMSYPRQPEEGVEFLGAFDQLQQVKKRDDVDAVRTTHVAAVNPPKLFSIGPNVGRITNVVDVSSNYGQGNKLPFFDVDVARRARAKPLLVPVGVPVTGDELSAPEVADLAGSGTREVVFKAYAVTEDVPRYRAEESKAPAEELIRPGWYGSIWSPSEIGKVYRAFFSTGSITDPQTVVRPSGEAEAAVSEEQEQALAEQEKAEDAEDPRYDAPAVTILEEGSSVQQAVEFLHLTYSYIKQKGLDIDQFIISYTWRPIATMIDMFGTFDLEYSPDGEEQLAGIEGFHSKAFGPYENLFGLVSTEIESVLGISRGSIAAQRADTRKRKLEKVQSYAAALQFSRAILG